MSRVNSRNRVFGSVRTLETTISRSAGSIRGPPMSNQSNRGARAMRRRRSEEHTSELQSLAYLVCRLLLEKKNNLIYLQPLAYKLSHVIRKIYAGRCRPSA